MANFIMNPLPAVSGTTKIDFQSQQVSKNEGASFSKYVEKKAVERDEGQSMLGVRKTDLAPKKQSSVPQKQSSEKISFSEDEQVVTAAGLLQQLIQKLQELSENKKVGAGEWKFLSLEVSSLEKLAEKAGMEASDIQAMLANLAEGKGELGLLDLFVSLEQHFSQMNKVEPVSAPETSLPLLQTFLDKIGIPVEEIERIAELSVDDLGGFDLGKFLNALNEFEGSEEFSVLKADGQLQMIPLTDWETEQLQQMLQTAGLSDEMLEQLFPEKVALWKQAIHSLGDGKNLAAYAGDSPVNMDLERLKNLLGMTIADAEAVKPKVDVPAFLSELEKVLGQAGFKDEGVGWSPVVQESLDAVYKELQKMVDMAKVKVEKINEFLAAEEALVQEWLASARKEGSLPGGNASLTKEGSSALLNFMAEQGSEIVGGSQKALSGDNLASLASIAGDDNNFAELLDNRIAASRMRMRPEIQQLTFDQISQSVMRGLKNSQHQLTLTLYPRELGEVKVDMMVKNNQVALSFLMENPKVKELIESNMQEFKDSMEQKGFVLEQFDVSVDQEGDSEKYMEQFEMLTRGLSEKERKMSLAELNELVMKNNDLRLSYHDGQISLMA